MDASEPTDPSPQRPKLAGQARRHLRALAHSLEPVVQVGTEGLSEAVQGATKQALHDHELIKVRLGPGFRGDRHDAAQAIAVQTDAHLVQLIGRVVVLYRARRGPAPGRPTIELPAIK